MKFNFHNGSKENRRGGFSVAVKIFSAIFAKPPIFLYIRLRTMTTRRRKMRNTEHEMLQFVTNKVKPIYTTNSTSSDGGSGQRVGSLSRRQLDKKARGGVNSNLHSRVHVYTIYNVTYVGGCWVTNCECLDLTPRRFQKDNFFSGNSAAGCCY